MKNKQRLIFALLLAPVFSPALISAAYALLPATGIKSSVPAGEQSVNAKNRRKAVFCIRETRGHRETVGQRGRSAAPLYSTTYFGVGIFAVYHIEIFCLRQQKKL